MGDKVIVERVELIYGHLYQIDLYNETRNEHFRTFIEKEEFESMADNTGIE